MMRIFLLLSMLVFSGCELTDPKEDSTAAATIKNGLYENKQNISVDGEFYTLTLQIRFDGSAYQYNGFANEVEIRQEKGSWKVNGESLETYSRLYRTINDAGGWGPWVSDTNGTAQIRNVTATSFQRYFKAEDVPEGIEGISTGWMTYNRIGD